MRVGRSRWSLSSPRAFLRQAIVAAAVVGVVGWPTLSASADGNWSVTSVAGGATPAALVDQLVGSNAGVTVVPNSVHFTGDPRGLASFSGGSTVGIDSGVAL